MKKRWISGLIIVTACALLTGCHIKHEWQEATCTEPRTCLTGGETEGEPLGHTWVEATCTEPKTCSACGETEGEPLGHTWVEATCTEPKTCSVCGETEGEPLGHTWVEANYQEPKTCSVCGETEGEPLTPAFEEHGLTADMELGVTYDYITTCTDDTSKKTFGKLTVDEYRIFDADETHEAKEGYEYREVQAHIVFNGNEDTNLYYYGARVYRIVADYYTLDDLETSDAVDYYGEQYEVEIDIHSGFGNWNDGIVIYELDMYCLVPVGYDGLVLAFCDDDGIDGADEMDFLEVVDENSHIFRLD